MMSDKFGKMMKKKDKKIDGVEKDAKMSVLSSLRDMASEAMGDKLKNLKKVTVASDSEEGLKKGLEKAEEIVEGGMPKMEDESEEETEELESSEEENEYSDMSEEELDAKLEQLMKLKKAKSE